MPSIVFVAGDPSGDFHAARLIEALKAKRPDFAFTGLGGAAMQRAGALLLDDLTTTAAIGPFDAAQHLSRFMRAKRLLENHLKRTRPDLAILVDFGDFNLPIIAPLIKRYSVPLVYYISPQLWAWGGFRLRYVRRYIDRMIVLFPFEETFYQREGIPVTWVGHPLVEHAQPTLPRGEAMKRLGLNTWRRTVGLLPGSRTREIERHLPIMLATASQISWRMPGVQFLLLKAQGINRRKLETSAAHYELDLSIAEGSISDIAPCMEVAVVASGTATLELALCGVPMVVVYRTSWMTYLTARALIRVPHIAMVNVLAERQLVPEFIQHKARPKLIAEAAIDLLRNQTRAIQMKDGLHEIKTRLGAPGAVERAAHAVLEFLKNEAECSRS